MRVTVATIGRLKGGPDRQLFERYWDRLGAGGGGVGMGPMKLVELPEGRSAQAAQRKSDEATRLGKAIADADYLIALDERGKTLTSQALATMLGGLIDNGTKNAVFAIGGPDGHDPAFLERAHMKLSLGSMTLPHGLARIVLAEQLYRAATILAGHPYHRS